MPACPADGQGLIKVRLSGVEVLGCPRCHGLWLGRQQIIELASKQAESAGPAAGHVAGPARTAATQRFCTVQCQAPLEPKIIRGIEIDRCLKCDGYWFDGGEVQRLLNSYGQGRPGRFRQKVNDDFQHPLKKPAAKSSSPSNLGRSMVDASLDTGAEAVLQIVLEGLSSIAW